ncbi:MAG: hypothetical protein K2N81_09750, partial [Acetatifactor sp.]|nr:hypothetical protein [Acetatifactor sp.]
MFAIQQDRKPVAGETTDTMRTAVPNITGIPDQMKAQFEDASGVSFDDVRIHYNSAEPIQQKRGKVSVNRWLNGLPSNIVQRKMDVGVALVPAEAVDKTLSAKEVMVDTVMLSGRADTGLKNGAGNKTQGDHIIADILIKKYQQVMCQNKLLPQVFNFYENIGTEMQLENLMVLERMEQPENKSINLNKDRIKDSNGEARNMEQKIKDMKDKSYKLSDWREGVTGIIENYNNAYARSYFATFGEGSKGRGEAQAMASLMDPCKNEDLAAKGNSQWDKLIDKDSLERALTALIPEDNSKDNLRDTMYQMVLNRFHVIKKQMSYVLNARLSE